VFDANSDRPRTVEDRNIADDVAEDYDSGLLVEALRYREKQVPR
jgi:hypothetical protein